jgi:NAD(P)-dependent dehydrogenase (short-subunit alcohol dehydrogenase family)
VSARRKRVLVIGGSGALGGAVTANLVARGARVALTYHGNEAAARDLSAAHGEAVAAVLPLDLASVASVEACCERAASALDGIDALVFAAAVGVTIECAGPVSHHRIAHFDEAAWDRMIDVNLKGAFFAVRALAGPLAAAGGGDVVLVSSVDGVKPVPSPVPYAASKAALGGMARALSKELGERSIRLNVVAPGVMDGGLSRDLPANLRDEYVKHCGLRRIGKMTEVAATVAWLALDNTYVTGQTLVVDGAL